jgi:uncharacterized cupredoxin-like copper-binding protein
MNVVRVTLLSATFLALAACGGGGTPPPSGSIPVDLKEWQVVVAKTVPAGSVTFAIKNSGSSAHELTIVKTDKAADKLANDGAKVTEPIFAESVVLNPGQTGTLTVQLGAGSYVFICNQPGHYPLGMRTSVTVQ